MARRRRVRRRRREGSAAVRFAAVLARVLLVVLVAVVVGYAFYLALSWVASGGPAVLWAGRSMAPPRALVQNAPRGEGT